MEALSAQTLLAVTLLACSHDSSAPALAPAEAIPAKVSIGGTRVTLGHETGALRRVADVDAFSITRFPVTVSEYLACVDAHYCSEPSSGAPSPNRPALTGSFSRDHF
jgi:formylglycine-generating enzyme required for sulfatase activity